MSGTSAVHAAGHTQTMTTQYPAAQSVLVKSRTGLQPDGYLKGCSAGLAALQ